MIGELDPTDKNVVIIGGGMSGLFAAYYLLKKNYNVTLYEASSRLGGMVATDYASEGLVERAAHSFRSCDALLALCADLKIEVVQAQTTNKYIYRFGRMKKFPLTLIETLRMLDRIVFAKALKEPVTMQSWADHHIGRAARENLITPLMRGIYACAPQDALQELVFPALTMAEGQTLFTHLIKKEKSKSNPIMTAPEKGMGALVQALAHHVSKHRNATIHLNKKLSIMPDSKNIIITVPAEDAAVLLGSSKTADALCAISYAPLITATTFVKNLNFPQGVGVLSAEGAPLHALGVLFNSSGLPGRITASDNASFSFMFGGTEKPEMVTESDSVIRTYIEEDFKVLFKQEVNIKSLHITRWPRALPVYNQNLKTALESARLDWCAQKGHVLFGNYTGQISLRGLCESASKLQGAL